MSHFHDLCTPAKIYFAIAVLSAIFMLLNGFGFAFIAVKMVFAFIWSFVLGWMCKKGYSSISWLLVLLPYIILVLALFNIYHATYEQKQMMKTVGLQDVYGQ